MSCIQIITSSIKLEFSYLIAQPRGWAVTSFCIQFGNRLDQQAVRERALPWYMSWI